MKSFELRRTLKIEIGRIWIVGMRMSELIGMWRISVR